MELALTMTFMLIGPQKFGLTAEVVSRRRNKVHQIRSKVWFSNLLRKHVIFDVWREVWKAEVKWRRKWWRLSRRWAQQLALVAVDGNSCSVTTKEETTWMARISQLANLNLRTTETAHCYTNRCTPCVARSPPPCTPHSPPLCQSCHSRNRQGGTLRTLRRPLLKAVQSIYYIMWLAVSPGSWSPEQPEPIRTSLIVGNWVFSQSAEERLPCTAGTSEGTERTDRQVAGFWPKLSELSQRTFSDDEIYLLQSNEANHFDLNSESSSVYLAVNTKHITWRSYRALHQSTLYHMAVILVNTLSHDGHISQHTISHGGRISQHTISHDGRISQHTVTWRSYQSTHYITRRSYQSTHCHITVISVNTLYHMAVISVNTLYHMAVISVNTLSHDGHISQRTVTWRSYSSTHYITWRSYQSTHCLMTLISVNTLYHMTVISVNTLSYDGHISQHTVT